MFGYSKETVDKLIEDWDAHPDPQSDGWSWSGFPGYQLEGDDPLAALSRHIEAACQHAVNECIRVLLQDDYDGHCTVDVTPIEGEPDNPQIEVDIGGLCVHFRLLDAKEEMDSAGRPLDADGRRRLRAPKITSYKK